MTFNTVQQLPVRDARCRLVALTRELIARHKAALAAQATLASQVSLQK